MTGTKTHGISDAMIDETLTESFPASDPPGWTLGVEAGEPAIPAPKGGRYVTRDAILKLLSDAENARVATLENAEQLAPGEEYIDLARPERGVLRVAEGERLVMGQVLPRRTLGDETWSKLVSEAHRGWHSPDSPAR